MKTLSLFFMCTVCSLSLWAMPEQVILLRHAEKPETGDSLSAQGFERAEALVSYFLSSPFSIQTPQAIYAQRSDKKHGSTRPVQTVAPLANFWQVPLYTTFSTEKYKGLVKEVGDSYTSGLVVICWSHDNLQAIAKEFGVQDAKNWPGSDYNSVWVLTFSDGKISSFQEYQQN